MGDFSRTLFIVLLGIVLIGLSAESTRRWTVALSGVDEAQWAREEGVVTVGRGEPGTESIDVFKADVVEAASIGELHNEVYLTVGEHQWENQVKPAFVGWVLSRAAADLGTPLPTDKQIVDWVRDHRDEAQKFLRDLKP